MIEPLMSDDLINRVGGRFRLTALIQKRWLELLQGARPLVDPAGKTEIEVVVQEIAEGKVEIDYDATSIEPPDQH
ncbi:MAG: DNA-directed RNA polymerase subunit omega [Planctomycetota bacterium]|nr:MAG: DNA-directed RNA polymerase subunit omega [Planctomycetota bacterium]